MLLVLLVLLLPCWTAGIGIGLWVCSQSPVPSTAKRRHAARARAPDHAGRVGQEWENRGESPRPRGSYREHIARVMINSVRQGLVYACMRVASMYLRTHTG